MAHYQVSDQVGEQSQISSAESHRYLGDILTTRKGNLENILHRRRKGITIINQIKSILEEGFFGYYYFEAALLLRQA